MSFDNSRNSFNHWNGYAGVVMEQGRVQTDADWNEWLAEQSRRARAGTLDILGRAACPVTTPNAFKIDATSAGDLRIGLGRMYVDGILVENFGSLPSTTTPWDPALAELSNTPQPQPATPQPLDAANSILFENQPFNNGATVPAGPGQYLAYLDVWQRPITFIEDPNLIDPAIGIDTTGRMQTAWRVNLLPMPVVVAQGSITSGDASDLFSSGDIITQGTNGATAMVIGAVPAQGPMVLSIVSGSPDGSTPWNDSSGAQFTPTSEPAGVGSAIAGSVPSTSVAFGPNEPVIQAGTGASAAIVGTVPSAGPMIVGPISGIPAPFANWIGQANGAIFAPAALPAGSVSSIQGTVNSTVQFLANEQVKQAGGAYANIIGLVPAGGPMLVGDIAGTPNESDDWIGQTSHASFVPGALPVVSGWNCQTPDSSIPWPGSSGTLTTQSATSPRTGPCCLTAGGGYTGPENQFYRIEIHTPGGAEGVGATFKWSRENASVQTAVAAISSATNSLNQSTNALTVQSLGRDQVLGFSAGDWIEITDQFHDNACLPGELYKIDSVSVPDSSIILASPLSANFSSTTVSNNAYTRIIRWDQSGEVEIGGTTYSLDATNSAASQPNGFTGIPIPQGSAVVLENGVAVTFGLSIANGSYQAMDYWNFTARAADGSIQTLTNQPPSGIAHHYAKLATFTNGVSSTPSATDCRKLWPPASSGGDFGCCCSVSVGPANSSASFTSIQKAIDSLHQGGKVCLDPGSYYENVLVRGKHNIFITGCGPRTRVYSQSLQPGGGAQAPDGGYTVSGFNAVFAIVASQNITIESLSIVAADEELGILMDQSTGKGWSQEGDLSYQLPDSKILLADLEISASQRSAIGARYVADLTICDSHIQMKDIASLYPAVYLEGDSIRFERNRVKVERLLRFVRPQDPVIVFTSENREQPLKPSEKKASKNSTLAEAAALAAAKKKAPSALTVGGVQIGGPSKDIWIVENEIDGSARNGITLGNIIYLDKEGNRDGAWVGATLDLDSACSTGGTSTIPGTRESGSTSSPVAAGGRIKNLHILRNRIRRAGMCGIGPVGFFNIAKTYEIVSLENVLIAENILVDTLQRNVLPASVDASPYGYGVISLPDVASLLIRSNMVIDYGISPGAEVCGIYIYHGEGVEIDSNQIRETRDLSGFRGEKFTKYGGKRAGIYIDKATPLALDTSSDSPWFDAAGKVFQVDASDAYRIQLPQFAPGFPALRIENNTVRVAFGLALHVEGAGPFSILGNHFATGGAVASDSEEMNAFSFEAPDLSHVGTDTGALTVSVVNMGLALEATEFLNAFLKLLSSDPSFASNPTSSLSVSNGTVLFSNNICQLMTQLNSVRGIASVVLATLDHIMFTNNQLWINGRRDTAFADAFLFGLSAQAVANRLQETAGAVYYSGASYGFGDATSQNICSYCFKSRGAKPAWWIQNPNVVFDSQRCKP